MRGPVCRNDGAVVIHLDPASHQISQGCHSPSTLANPQPNNASSSPTRSAPHQDSRGFLGGFSLLLLTFLLTGSRKR